MTDASAFVVVKYNMDGTGEVIAVFLRNEDAAAVIAEVLRNEDFARDIVIEEIPLIVSYDPEANARALGRLLRDG